jgi:hypothetical protein
VADAYNCVTTIEIQVLLAVLIPHFLTLSLYDIDREQAIYRK